MQKLAGVAVAYSIMGVVAFHEEDACGKRRAKIPRTHHVELGSTRVIHAKKSHLFLLRQNLSGCVNVDQMLPRLAVDHVPIDTDSCDLSKALVMLVGESTVQRSVNPEPQRRGEAHSW